MAEDAAISATEVMADMVGTAVAATTDIIDFLTNIASVGAKRLSRFCIFPLFPRIRRHDYNLHDGVLLFYARCYRDGYGQERLRNA